MGINQDRMILLCRAATNMMQMIQSARQIAQAELQANYTNEAVHRILQALDGKTLLDDVAVVSRENSHFTPAKIKHNRKAAERSRMWRFHNPGSRIKTNVFSKVAEIPEDELTPAIQELYESHGMEVKVIKPDLYDKIAEGHNTTFKANTEFTDDLRDVPKSEDDLFREPESNNAGENETDTE